MYGREYLEAKERQALEDEARALLDGLRPELRAKVREIMGTPAFDFYGRPIPPAGSVIPLAVPRSRVSGNWFG